jgi:hypothetical protein
MTTTALTDEAEGLRERVGTLLGRLWAPVIATIARARHARMFHPDGHTFTGVAVAADDPSGPHDPALMAVGRALTGRVLARFSGALWRGEVEHLDVLGLALRFRTGSAPFDAAARPGDTDLLTATIRSPLTLLAAPFVTDASDFVGNRYWAVSPFAVPDARVELRLVPIHDGPHEGSRLERLRAAVDAGRAAWWLQARRTLHLRWQRIARITITGALDVDQAALRFDPFRGALRPVGLIHAIRRAAYPASQGARPSHAASVTIVDGPGPAGATVAACGPSRSSP